MRRDPVEDFADEYDAGPEPRRKTAGQSPALKIKLGKGLRLPTSTAGLVATGVALLLILGVVFWLLAITRSFLLHDARFRIANAAAIELEGNRHVKRSQLLGLFSEDIERNIFGLSLEQRQADLEALPWVQRATVMRLLPGRLRVSLVERTPVAFVRQGGRIGLVDANGVLLEMNAGAQSEHYSFPVVTGIGANDPASTRAARMRIFSRFTEELDAGGARNTESLSEVDLSNPEDVKALVQEHGATVMVHFGEDQFLDRFKKVMELLPQWHAQYPNLASADLRYEHEIPLAMAAPVKSPSLRPEPKAVASAAPTHAVVPAKAQTKAPLKPVAHAAAKVPVHSSKEAFVPAPGVKPWQPSATAVAQPSVSAAARSSFVVKTPQVAKTVIAPAKSAVSVAPKRQVPNPPPVLAAQHSTGKPAAGKLLVSPDTTHSSQAVQP